MALPDSFLDQVRERVSLSSLIGATVKLTKAGREFKACCPFHGEKTPSFTVNDEKAFYHCFGCGAHGDVFRWMQDQRGLSFMDGVRELAAIAGIDVPAPTPQAAERHKRAETVREALDAAQAIYVHQLEQTGAVMEYLTARGIGPDEVAAFGIGYARAADGSLRGRIGAKVGAAAGLLVPRTDNDGLRELFWDRITIPIHNSRGALVGFGARVWPGRRTSTPKFVNSPDSELFDKGRTLFNLHRAAPAARPQAENRLIVAEGYFDVVALSRVGIAAAVAPMGTALTQAQLERCWRLHHRPFLLMDGDAAGRKAAERACVTALPMLGPGRELAIALLPDGQDPDDLVRELGLEAGAAAIGAALDEARPVHAFVFDTIAAAAGAERSPEQTAAVWEQLSELAHQISDTETRAQYLGVWRARFEREISAVPQLAASQPVHSVVQAENPAADGSAYAFPESEGDSAGRLIQIVKALVRKREERREIGEEIKDIMAMAELAGFQKKAITAAVRDIEEDLKHGPAKREEDEMHRVLYRRVLGIRGPMEEAMMPQLVDARPKQLGAGARRKATTLALIEARAIEI